MWSIRLRIRAAMVMAAVFVCASAGAPSVDVFGRQVVWGYVDRTGKMVIPPRFGWPGDFHDGMANVGRFEFIDKKGKVVIGPRAGWAWDFSEGVALTNTTNSPSGGPPRYGGSWRFIGTHGRVVLEPRHKEFLWRSSEYTTVCSFHDGLAAVMKAGPNIESTGISVQFDDPHAGYIDRSGKVVIPLKYTSASDFSEGLAAVQVGSRFGGYIDKSGKLVIPAGRYEYPRDFSEGLALVTTPEDRSGRIGRYFIDRRGRVVISEGRYRWVEEQFHGGLLPVENNGAYGYVDRTGRIAIRAQYGYAERFSDGLGPVRSQNRYAGLGGQDWSYINRKGRTVLRPTWNGRPCVDARPFSEGLAAVGFRVLPARRGIRH